MADHLPCSEDEYGLGGKAKHRNEETRHSPKSESTSHHLTLEVVRNYTKKPSEYFTHIAGYKKAWQKAAREAGLPDRSIYDTRSTFASRANACKETTVTIAQLLGRATNIQILPAYVKPLNENAKAVIEALDAVRVTQSTASRSIQEFRLLPSAPYYLKELI